MVIERHRILAATQQVINGEIIYYHNPVIIEGKGKFIKISLNSSESPIFSTSQDLLVKDPINWNREWQNIPFCTHSHFPQEFYLPVGELIYATTFGSSNLEFTVIHYDKQPASDSGGILKVDIVD